MNNRSIINYGSLISIVATTILAALLLFEISYNHLIIKSFFFFGLASVIFTSLFALASFCYTCSANMKKLITTAGLITIAFSFIILYGFFGLSEFWHILLGFTILLVLLVELQMLGWTAKKQGIVTKLTFLIALLSNSFLAFVFIFKISLHNIKPLLVIACLLSILSLFYGLFFYQSKKG